MKKYQIFYFFALINITINAQNKLNQSYIDFAENFLSAMKSNDINEYRKLYATKDEFEDYVDKNVTSKRDFYKDGFDKYYYSYEEYVSKSYKRYIKHLEKDFLELQKLNSAFYKKESGANWVKSSIECVYLKYNDNTMYVVLYNKSFYYLIELEVNFFYLKNVFYHNELKFKNGFEKFKKIGNYSKFKEFCNNTKMNYSENKAIYNKNNPFEKKTSTVINFKGLYYFPGSCIFNDDTNSLKSKKGMNCLTIEFLNNDEFILTERDSSKKPFIMKYRIHNNIIQAKDEKESDYWMDMFINHKGNLRCIHKGIVGDEGIYIDWIKMKNQ